VIDHSYLIDSWGIDVTSIETVRIDENYCKTLLTTTEPWALSALRRKFDTVQYMRDTDVYIGSSVTITPKSSPAYAAKANNIKRILKSPGEDEEVAALWDAFGTYDLVPSAFGTKQPKQRTAARTLLQMSRAGKA
jgi:hypothetical protein